MEGVQLLLKHGVDPNRADPKGATPLDGCKSGSPIAVLLEEHGTKHSEERHEGEDGGDEAVSFSKTTD
jgi:hypothetical protein